MAEEIAAIEKRIAALREQLRNTLDRSKLPGIRAQLMDEIAKLSAVGDRPHGHDDDDVRKRSRG